MLLTTNEACAYLKVSRKTLFRLCAKRKVEHYDMPQGFRFDQASLDTYIASCRVEATESAGSELPLTPAEPITLAEIAINPSTDEPTD